MSEQQPSRLLLNNWTSLFGVVILMVGLAAGAVLLIADAVQGQQIQYVVLPYLAAGLGSVAGLLLTLIGYLIARRRARRGEPAHVPFLLRLDLQNPGQRNLAIGITFAGLVLIGMTGAATFGAVDYVESDEFCTQACHSVMVAEGTTHATSPHAKVPCVKCHVGSGAESFAKSKVRGLSQLMATVTGSYHRPIGVPVESMQPARETCEQCHWNRRWIGFKEKLFNYYSSDDDNAHSQLRMLMKVGGATSSELLQGDGIHFHMSIGRRVEFIARDDKKQNIAWVRMTDPDGRVVEYASEGKPLTDEERSTLPVHVMDCMDCHNRPAHQFSSPMLALNRRLASGQISAEVPAIKLQGVKALTAEYESTEAAMKGIASSLRSFYEEEQADYYEEHHDDVEKAISGVQAVYRENFFPEMKASWASYPDNLGHRDSPGCFRCHNDDMVTEDGDPIFTTCTKCHIVLEQGESLLGEQTRAQTFFHPADEENLDEYTECVDCHDGGPNLY